MERLAHNMYECLTVTASGTRTQNANAIYQVKNKKFYVDGEICLRQRGVGQL